MSKNARSTTGCSAVIIADIVAEVATEDSRCTDISKGVILNAIRQDNTQKGNKKRSEFNQMSFFRKIAFGFSFLPSIIFVLCFAVILPCEKFLPCVDVQWKINFNDTGITSNLLVPSNVLFAFSNSVRSGLRSLSESSGQIVWEKNFTMSSIFFNCGRFLRPDKHSCFIADNNGTIHVFDPSDGRKLWEMKLKTSFFSLTVLPDCNKDGLDEIAVSTADSQIKILSLRNILIKNCDPLNLIPWKTQNETHLIFTCDSEENEILMKISQEDWCERGKSEGSKLSTLLSQKAGILSQSKFLAVAEGLILWTKDFITMFNNDNQQEWSVPILNHTLKNRFLMSGKFRNGKEVFLYSSEISSSLQITRLNAKNGNIIATRTYPQLELSEAVLINGEEHDFILGLTKKFSLKTEEVLSSISTKIIQEIKLMEMNGNHLKTIQSEEMLMSESHESSLTVSLKKNLMKLFVIRKPQNSHSGAIKSIKVSNWDDKSSHCIWN